MKEIERKFLVNDLNKAIKGLKGRIIRQGYLMKDSNFTVRIRIIDNEEGYLTLKSKRCRFTRDEYEYSIPLNHARDLMKSCSGIIFKHRYERMTYHNTKLEDYFVIDVFHGDNEGLILAEIELENEKQEIKLPSWVGKEVTEDPRYYNAFLSKNPYKEWPNESQN